MDAMTEKRNSNKHFMLGYSLEKLRMNIAKVGHMLSLCKYCGQTYKEDEMYPKRCVFCGGPR